MPKVAVYKGNNSIIPVKDAIVGTGYRCPWTKQVFSSKKDYVSHLKNHRSVIRDKIYERNHDAMFQDFINQPSFADIIRWIEDHPRFFLKNAVRNGSRSNSKYLNEIKEKFWVKITYLSVKYDNRVSNSHSCPRGERTNWGGRDTYKDGTPVPLGYPGWQGRIEFQINPEIISPGTGSDVFRGLGINTGSGGGITENRFGYDVKFFTSDWPGLEKSVIFQILKDAQIEGFRYGDPKYFRAV